MLTQVAAPREDIIKSASASGFSQPDLWNPDIAIARIVAEAWADRHASQFPVADVDPTAVILAALKYEPEDNETPEDLAKGLRALPTLCILSGDARPLARIARLLSLHARSTHTSPVDVDFETHCAELLAVSRRLNNASLKINRNEEFDPKTLAALEKSVALDEDMDWLVRKLPILWD